MANLNEKVAIAQSEVQSLVRQANVSMGDKAVTSVVSGINTKLNEAMENFKSLHLDYLAEKEDEEEKIAVQRQHDNLATQVKVVTDLITTYLYVNNTDEHDSASKVSGRSKGSGTSSVRARAVARKAALNVEKQMLARKHELDMAAQRLKQEQEQLALETEMSKAAAEELALADMEEEEEDRQSNSVFHSVPAPPSTKDSEVMLNASAATQPHMFYEQQQRLIDMMSAPRLELSKFNGDPLKYYVFMQTFQESVEKTVKDSAARLARLMQYCEGQALKALQPCAIMPPDEGYKQAKYILKKRFGDQFAISQAWVANVTAPGGIKPNNGQALQDFADDLRNCLVTLKAMKCLSVVSQADLLKILGKLPGYLLNRWRTVAVKLRRKEERLPTLEDLVAFVEDAAEEANDPIYGTIRQTEKVESKDTRPKRTQASYATNMRTQEQAQTTFTPYNENSSNGTSSNYKCKVCEGAHHVYACVKFKALGEQKRFEVSLKNGLCFNCLKPGHSSKDCRSPGRCAVNGCGKKHHSLLHKDIPPQSSYSKDKSNDSPMDKVNVQNGFADTKVGCLATGAGHKRIALPIVAVNVKAPNGGKTVKTYALLDSGSTNSFCAESLLDELGIEGIKESIALTTLEKSQSVSQVRIASLEVSDMYKSHEVKLPVVYARPNLPINHENIATCEDISCWPHLQGIDLPEANTDQVLLLIGQDAPDALIPREVIKGDRDEPYATKTLLGWALNGPMKHKRNNKVTSHFITASQPSDELLHEKVEKFWKLESAGMFDDTQAMSVNDKKVLQSWDETGKFQNGHYEFSIPFKHQEPRLPDNMRMAESRLYSLGRKLDKNPDLKAQYAEGITDLLHQGYAIKVPEQDIARSDGKVWYLPHHPVINPRKDKIRIVFDCAARHVNTSLNSNVHQGPDLTNKLVGVLMRFRQEEVAFMADIQAMFHQVKVTPTDQDVLRFLWWPGGDTSQPPEIYRMNVHLFGGTWSPSCCTYALQKAVEDFGQGYSADTRHAVMNNFYVDDLLKSVPGIPAAIQMSKELKELLARAGFNLTKWICNRAEVNEALQACDKPNRILELTGCAPVSERALGVIWDVNNDVFSYKISPGCLSKPYTKRGLLSMLSGVYDPLGYASPFILKARKIVQDLFRIKAQWDDAIPDEQKSKWIDWIADLPNMESFQVPRCIKPIHFGQVVNYQLHHFADASEIAYGVVSYLHVENEEGEISSRLIMSKCRLAPLKTMTIPRLELSAATLAVKQDSYIRREIDLDVHESHFWTDSTIVLQYINSENKRFQTFVANRVTAIRDGSDPSQWHHVGTKQNPADHVSRGLAVDGLSSQMWLNGPPFLTQDKKHWPQVPTILELAPNDPEVKKSAESFATKTGDPLDTFIRSFSSWPKLKTAVAWILAVKMAISKRGKPKKMLQARDLKEAEAEILKYIQRQNLAIEIAAVERNESHRCPEIKSLQPVMRDGLLCVGGRLTHSPTPEHFKCPILLPKNNHVVDLMIEHMHQASGHAGREYVLAASREKYWIIGARRAIRRVIGKCVPCKKRDAPVCGQKMGDLPADRVTPGDPAFTFVGVDYFGPFLVKRGRGREKRYGCLFTCLAIRAIHIEVAHSLEADAFINCLNRFMARRGRPKRLRSDNGTNFVGAERELRQEIERWNVKRIQDVMNEEGIEWLFNVPGASHMGGSWERQIRSVRKILSSLTTEQVLTDESLSTLMCMAEAIVNNRPITTVSSDPRDLDPLTPNHLLLLRPVSLLPGLFDQCDLYSRKKWRQIQYLADLFWARWVKEYLPQLQGRSKWIQEKRNLSIGDIVLIVDTTLPRNEWSLGRIIEVFKGSDGRVRSVKLKTKATELMRPITKVCLIESAQIEDSYKMNITPINEE